MLSLNAMFPTRQCCTKFFPMKNPPPRDVACSEITLKNVAVGPHRMQRRSQLLLMFHALCMCLSVNREFC